MNHLNIRGIVMKFGSDVHVPLRIKYKNYSPPDFSSGVFIWSTFELVLALAVLCVNVVLAW